jgi:RimJ/RimL family protein N-acetyltransferase
MPLVDELIREGELAIRRMRGDPDDYGLLVRWRNEPHVADWWTTDDDPTPTTLDRVVEKYGPRTDLSSLTTSNIITLNYRPIGYVQFYLWNDHADEMRAMGFAVDDGTFGLDILIGEPDLLDRGIGSRTVALLARHLFQDRDAKGVALLTPRGQRTGPPGVREGWVQEGRADAGHRHRERRAADELADGPRTTPGMMQRP